MTTEDRIVLFLALALIIGICFVLLRRMGRVLKRIDRERE